jgi:hypothetical protein
MRKNLLFYNILFTKLLLCDIKFIYFSIEHVEWCGHSLATPSYICRWHCCLISVWLWLSVLWLLVILLLLILVGDTSHILVLLLLRGHAITCPSSHLSTITSNTTIHTHASIDLPITCTQACDSRPQHCCILLLQ